MSLQPLVQEITVLHAEMCSALSDPSRILILYLLANKPYTVNDMASELGIPQPAASRHLKVLRERGIVNAERQGVNVTYSLVDARMIQALELLRKIMSDRIAHRASLLDVAFVGEVISTSIKE